MTYPIRQRYEPDLYVGREQELEKANEWWKVKKRLLSVKAPPATGKTWFLKRVEETFESQKIVTFWIDVKDLLLPPHERVARGRKLNPELVKLWLTKLVDDINKRFSNLLADFDFSNDLSTAIEQFAHEISERCQSDHDICIFIDDGDQIDDEGWREFERWFLEPFAKQKTLRFVIATREKRPILASALRWSEQRIKLAALNPTDHIHPGLEQLDLLLEKKYFANSPTIRRILRILQDRGYEPTHPGLNSFICLFVQDEPELEVVLDSINFLKSAIEAVNPQLIDEIEYIVELLKGIAALKINEWDIEILADAFQIPRRTAWEYVQVLEDNALITRPNLNRFTVVDGIREFIRALLEEEISLTLPSLRAESRRPTLHYRIDSRFSLDELIEICFNLNISPENTLVGGRKLNKIIFLINYLKRRERLSDLIGECRRLRPTVNWSQ